MKRVDQKIIQGGVVKVLPSGSHVLHTPDSKDIRLVTPAGKLTQAGTHYYEKTGTTPPSGLFDPQRPLLREKDKEFVVLRNGKRRLARTYDPVQDDYRYTRIGKQYFANTREEYLLSLPVKISGRNKRTGAPYERTGFLPSDALGLPKLQVDVTLTQDQKDEKLKKQVLDQIDPENLLTVSDETFSLRETNWLISKLTTRNIEGELSTSTVLNRELAAETPFAFSHLMFPADFHPSTFETSQNCVLHQLTEIFQINESVLKDHLEDIARDLYGEVKYTANLIAEWCRKTDRSIHVVYGSTIIHQDLVAKNKHKGTYCCNVWGGHLYSYASNVQPSLKRKKVAPLRYHRTEIVSKEAPGKKLDPEEYKEWEGLAAGKYFAQPDQMQEILQLMIGQRRIPKVKMQSFNQIKELTLNDHKGETVVRAFPTFHSEMQEFAAHLSFATCRHIPWNGEGLANFTLKVLRELMLPERSTVILEGGTCAVCGNSGTQMARDHIIPLSLRGGCQGQLLCAQCHNDKTTAESLMNKHHRGKSLNPMLSFFNPHVWKHFVEKNKPLQVVKRFKEPTDQALLVDVARCRRRALTNPNWGIPVFSALDEIEEAKDLEGDFFYIKRARDSLGVLFTGARWYHKCVAEQLLHTHMCTMKDIPWKIKATGHLKDAFAAPFRAIEKAWQHCSQDLGKQAINSVIGLMGSRENCLYSAVISTDPQDSMLLQGTVNEHQEGDITQWVAQTKVLSYTSMLPCYYYALDYERLMVFKICQFDPTDVIEIRTDSVLFAKTKKKRKLAQLTLEDIGSEGQEKAFHVETIDPPEPPREFDPTSTCDPPTDLDFSWTTHDEDHCDVWAKAEEIVMSGQSLRIEGGAGVGKSTLTKKLVAKLRERGERVVCTSLTHVAARILEGQTIQSFLHRYVISGTFSTGGKPSWLVIDEYSMLGISICSFLAQLLLTDTKFIVIGDEHQLEHPANCWAGEIHSSTKLSTSRLLWEMCGGNMVLLSKCRRSNPELFNIYQSFLPGGCRSDWDVAQQVAYARTQFPRINGVARFNICISHLRRKYINRCCWDLAKKDRTLKVKFQDELVNAIYPGMPCIGNATVQQITNGAFYQVLGWTNERIEIEDIETKERHTVKPELFSHMHCGFSATYPRMQGRTLTEHTRLWDTSHKHFSKKHLALGISRVSDRTKLDIA